MIDHPEKITNSADGSPKIILIDFDGVFVDTKEFDLHKITGERILYAIPWLQDLMDHNFDVRIFSARCNTAAGIETMRSWFLNQNMPTEYFNQLKFEPGKPSCHMIIDDRAVTFRGNPLDWTPGVIRDFVPWNRIRKINHK